MIAAMPSCWSRPERAGHPSRFLARHGPVGPVCSTNMGRTTAPRAGERSEIRPMRDDEQNGVSRRDFLQTGAAVAGASGLALGNVAAARAADEPKEASKKTL